MSDLKNLRQVLSESHDLIDFDILDAAYSELKALESTNAELEKELATPSKRPPPCGSGCEATAFNITIKNLKSTNAELDSAG